MNQYLLAGQTIAILNQEFGGKVTDVEFNAPNSLKDIDFSVYGIVKTKFQRIIVDTAYVEKFDVERSTVDANKTSIVTLYDTGADTKKILGKLGIPIFNEQIIDDTTILLIITCRFYYRRQFGSDGYRKYLRFSSK
ncbi:MAG: hypothetical protein V9E84_05335 [Trichococcus flocculiformis]